MVDGSYLALRLGNHEIEKVQALNAGGEIVYVFEPSSPAEGKR